MEEEVKSKLTELTKSSGVEGMERLAALFLRKHEDLARTMSMSKLKGLANEVLKKGPGKQILAYPQNLSGGRIHASSPMRYGRRTPPVCSPLAVGIFCALLMSLLAALGLSQWLRQHMER